MSIEFSIIVAHDQNHVIGVDGEIPWKINEDLIRFKKLTMGGVVIMGKHTWNSLKHRPLPGRTNIVLSSNSGNFNLTHKGVHVVNSMLNAIDIATKSGTEKVFFIGGTRVYLDGYRYCDTIYRTLIDTAHEYKGSISRFDQEISSSKWELVAEEPQHGYKFQTFKRKKT